MAFEGVIQGYIGMNFSGEWPASDPNSVLELVSSVQAESADKASLKGSIGFDYEAGSSGEAKAYLKRGVEILPGYRLFRISSSNEKMLPADELAQLLAKANRYFEELGDPTCCLPV